MYCTATVHLVCSAPAPVPDYRCKWPGRTRRSRWTAKPASVAALTSALVALRKASVGSGGSAAASSRASSTSRLHCASPSVQSQTDGFSVEQRLQMAEMRAADLEAQLEEKCSELAKAKLELLVLRAPVFNNLDSNHNGRWCGWDRDEIENYVQSDWKYEAKPWQLEAACAASEGKHSLICETTGAGKSLCYQVIALMDWHRRNGFVTVVVEPFVQTILSQMESLKACGGSGYEHFAGFLGCAQSDAHVIEKALAGNISLVFMCPETFVKCWPYLKNLQESGLLRLVVVDEAQCVVEQPSWRSAYGEQLVKGLLQLHVPKMLLSASLLRGSDYEEVKRMFALDGPDVYEWQGRSYRNIQIDMVLKRTLSHDANRIFEFVAQQGRFIIYVRKVSDCETVYQHLAQDCELGDDVVRFHKGGQSQRHRMTTAEQRESVGRFKDGKSRVMVTTIAFCMGLDIPDVDGVIVYDPRSLTELFQQMGRAGRSASVDKPRTLVFYPGYLQGNFESKKQSKSVTERDIEFSDDICHEYKLVMGIDTDYQVLQQKRQQAMMEIFCNDECYWIAMSRLFDSEEDPNLVKKGGCGHCSACRLKQEQSAVQINIANTVLPLLKALNDLESCRTGYKMSRGVKLGTLFDEVRGTEETELVVGKGNAAAETPNTLTRRLLSILWANGLVDLQYGCNIYGCPYCIASITPEGREAINSPKIKVRMSPLVHQMQLACEG